MQQKQFNNLRIEYEEDLNIRLKGDKNLLYQQNERIEKSHEQVGSWDIFETEDNIDFGKIQSEISN